jgi:isopenicillin-N N-acyltransferase like protein
MLIQRRWFCLLLISLAACSTVGAAETRAFQEGRFEKGELKYVNHLPVLAVEGTPEEMGRQEAALTGTLAKTLAEYPRQLLIRRGHSDKWDRCLETARTLMSHASKADRDELRNFAERAGISLDLLTVGNAIMDIHRGGFACSSLMVDANKSQTGGILFGRNLDFYSLGVLDRYGLITVRRPKEKHAFATVGFPGLMGCLSGMNDAGLAIAVHEVPLSADGAPLLNVKAGPAGLVFRRILEECKTIEEAEKLLRGSERSTILSLAICDRRHSGVLEITPKNVVLRTGSKGICVNTNHFRSDLLCLWKICPRYATLSKAVAVDKLGVEDIFHKLDEVNQGQRTVQSMVFEPQPLILHVAMGKCPATKGSLDEVDLTAFFGPTPHDSK